MLAVFPPEKGKETVRKAAGEEGLIALFIKPHDAERTCANPRSSDCSHFRRVQEQIFQSHNFSSSVCRFGRASGKLSVVINLQHHSALEWFRKSELLLLQNKTGYS